MPDMSFAHEQLMKTYYLEARTNGEGCFSVPHGLTLFTGGGFGIDVAGIVVSVQHENGNWHNLEKSKDVDNRFWWNNHRVEGMLVSPHFYNRPVQIILFIREIIG